jgi:hypothetical protein
MRRVRVRLTVWIVLLVVATSAFAFVALPRDGGNPFRAYAAAPLVPGLGLGDLRVGATQLGAFVERYGVGQPAALYGDDTALEFAFPRAGLTFTFVAGGDCIGIVQAMAGTGLRALRSPRSFVRDHPACAATPLDRIAVAAARAPRDTFWRGATPMGIALHQDRADVLGRLGYAPDRASDADRPPPERWFDPAGLQIDFGPAATGGAEPARVVVRLTVTQAR